jgi:three-Cys-motif partner protein
MPINPDDYFKSKRPWAKIKNSILGSYLKPYVAKISRRGQPLLFIDAFAGPGKNEEDNSAGSPLLICQAASTAKAPWQAYFFNNRKNHHENLTEILKAGGWKQAQPILGDAPELINAISSHITDESVFLYIDPFGLTCEFDTLKPFLNRNPKYSTELLINLNAAGLHRLASRNAIEEGEPPDQVEANHEKLTRVLGGDYWKEALLSSDEKDTKIREEFVVHEYMKRLRSTGYLKYTGSCPVQEYLSSPTKYYMISASPHPDSLLLFNEAMGKAFNDFMHKQENPLFAFNGQDWKTWRDIGELVEIVVEYVEKYPKKTRNELWFYIVQDNFMRFLESEYIKAVATAVETGRIICSTPIKSKIRPTKRLNGDCVFEPII